MCECFLPHDMLVGTFTCPIRSNTFGRSSFPQFGSTGMVPPIPDAFTTAAMLYVGRKKTHVCCFRVLPIGPICGSDHARRTPKVVLSYFSVTGGESPTSQQVHFRNRAWFLAWPNSVELPPLLARSLSCATQTKTGASQPRGR